MSIKNPTSDFVSFPALGQLYFNVDPTLKGITIGILPTGKLPLENFPQRQTVPHIFPKESDTAKKILH